MKTNENKLNDKQASKVSGGTNINWNEDEIYGYYHEKDGGRITGIGNIFKSCKCKICGKSKYMLWDFTDKKTLYGPSGKFWEWHYSDGSWSGTMYYAPPEVSDPRNK